MIQERKQKSSSKLSLILSAIFHVVLIAVIIFFAAREGMLGKKLKQLTVVMVPKEKKPEPPKGKPVEPKEEPPKTAAAPKVNVPQPKVQTALAPPPAVDAPPAVAPAAAVLSGMDFSDGAKEVQTISDPVQLYKALVENTLRSRWNRPEDMADDNFIAEVELSMDASGKIKNFRWLSGSGNARWDNTVKAVFNETKSISRPPPKTFPATFTVRFDVESMRTESLQLSSR